MNAGQGTRDRGTIEDVHFALSELIGKMDSIIRIGQVRFVNYQAGKVRVEILGFSGTEQVLTDWIPWAVSRASLNRQWEAPEINEQVIVFSPGGKISNAFAMPALNYAGYPHLAANADYHCYEYRYDDEPVEDGGELAQPAILAAFMEMNRRTTIRRWWMKPDTGTFRWEIGGRDDETGSGSSIVMNRNEIQFRVGETQIIITGNDNEAGDRIRLLVNGRESELRIEPEQITAQVKDSGIFTIAADKIQAAVSGSGVLKVLAELVEMSVDNEGVLSVRSNSISMKLESMQVRFGLFADQIKGWVKDAWIQLQEMLIDLRIPGSAITIQPPNITMETPSFSGVQGSAQPGVYLGGAPSVPFDDPPKKAPDIEIPAPKRAEGNPPSRPITGHDASSENAGLVQQIQSTS